VTTTDAHLYDLLFAKDSAALVTYHDTDTARALLLRAVELLQDTRCTSFSLERWIAVTKGTR